MKVNMIVAIGPNNIIGLRDKLVWHSKVDLQHFKDTTSNKPVIFGSTTFFGLPKYPLPNRLNIVLDNSPYKVFDINALNIENGGYVEATSIESALSFCKNFDEVFICGGASIYKYCLENNLIDKIYLTKIQCSLEDRDDYIKFPIDIPTFCDYNTWDAKLVCTNNEEKNLYLEFWTYTKK